MKKAANQLRKGRRNKGQGDSSSEDPALNSNEQQQHQIPQQPSQPPGRRKPTTEEAALTAKNYRLAKELSDLRVRHREECKNVSRLSMENMNLASRWRGAVNHVNLLKKELAIQQRKNADILAQQRRGAQASSEGVPVPLSDPEKIQQQQKISPSSVMVVEKSPAKDVAAEMDRMDRILAKAQASSRNQQNQLPEPTQTESEASKKAFETERMGDPKTTPKTTRDQDFAEDGDEKKSQSMDQTVTPSPEKKERATSAVTRAFEEEEDVFALFMETSNVDITHELDVDDPPIESPTSVTPTESPPISPHKTNKSTPPHISPPTSNRPTSMAMIKKQGASPLFPMTASPKLVVPSNSRSYNEEFPSDITAEATRHTRSVERKPMPNFNDIEEEEQSMSSSKLPQEQRRPSVSPLSGIDAFEASFATKFPDSFSPAEVANDTASAKQHNRDEELYNPFFPNASDDAKNGSPRKISNDKYSMSKAAAGMSTPSNNQGQGKNEKSASFNNDANTARVPMTGTFEPNSRENNTSSPSSSNNAEAGGTQMTIDGNQNTTTQTPPIQRYSSTKHPSLAATPPQRYQTPPHAQKSPESGDSSEPKRPEKMGAVAARARYEKALHPRGYASNSRQFPRRVEWEADRGASPVHLNRAEKNENPALEYDGSMLANAQARIKGRTAFYTAGRTSQSATAGQPFSIHDHKWNSTARGPSPTNSVSSKPWDEEVGDIPMESASNKAATRRTPDSYTATMIYNSKSIQTNNNEFASSSSTRQPVGGYRPWDTWDQQSTIEDDSMSMEARNFSGEPELLNGNNDAPHTRFVTAGRSRRNVKQPISYAEPSISSKLRRGDVFFAKPDRDTLDNEGREQCVVQEVSRSPPVHL